MKKMKRTLIASLMTLIMLLPTIVDASTTLGLTYSRDKVLSDGYYNDTVVVSLEVKSGDDYTVTTSDEISITVNYNTAEMEFKGAEATGSDFSFTKSGDVVTAKLTNGISKTYSAGDKVELGTIYLYYKSTIEDCYVNLETSWGKITLEDLELEENVQTGINMPIVAVGAAGVLAIGTYATVSKKSKIHSI